MSGIVINLEWNGTEPIRGRATLKLNFFSLIILYIKFLLFYCSISLTVNNTIVQYTINVLFNAHRYVVDLILTTGVIHR